MSERTHCDPSDLFLEALAVGPRQGPLIALNLNRYRQRAVYPPGTPDADVSGREAYLRYGVVALPAILQVGGRIVWAANAEEVAIGCDHDAYDEVVAVWYPDRSSFLALEHYPGYREAFELHRRAAIEHATLLFFTAGTQPQLVSPYGS